jgi:hypothetical protein
MFIRLNIEKVNIIIIEIIIESSKRGALPSQPLPGTR